MNVNKKISGNHISTVDVRFYFERAVNTYEKAGRIQKTVAEELLKRIKGDYYPIVLEIGSGRGFLSKPLAEKIIFDKFIHVDISFQFLKKLKVELNGFFINARAEFLPLKEGIADLLISSSTLHWVKEHEKAFTELFDILKRRGKFYFSIFTGNTLKELRHISKLSGFGSVYSLKEAGFYVEIMERMKIPFSYEIKTYRELYSSPRELLLSHKLTGTNYTEGKKFSGKNSFKKFCELYRAYFSNHEGIYATYEVLFIEGQK